MQITDCAGYPFGVSANDRSELGIIDPRCTMEGGCQKRAGRHSRCKPGGICTGGETGTCVIGLGGKGPGGSVEHHALPGTRGRKSSGCILHN